METVPNLPGIAWDACGLLNLMALPNPADVLTSLGCQSYVVSEVRMVEVLALRPLPEQNLPAGTFVPVDLTSLISGAHLQETTFNNADEISTFVAFAAQIDDGEARSLAIAHHRNLWLATDDKRAIRVASSLPIPTPVLTTPQWLKLWSERHNIEDSFISQAIRCINLQARYIPNRSDPLHGWWSSF